MGECLLKLNESMIWIWITLAAVAAILIALIQYNYLFSRAKDKRRPWFAVLRATTVFCILLLFLAPKFEKKSYQTLKPQLVVMVDNSSSIDYLEARKTLEQDLELILNDADLNDKFDVVTYRFDESVKQLDSLSFTGNATDISQAISQPQELFRDRNKSIVVLTDGNQTVGTNYQYSKINRKTHLYPIIYGDTTSYPDIRINQLNVNRYSYLKNEYPVEVFISYSGEAAVTTVFKIKEGNTTLYQQPVTLSPAQKSAVLNFNLTSQSVGLHKMLAQVGTLPAEKNVKNNKRDFAVEVIDQQSKILILTNTVHPDIGALKSAIESNQQRKVTIKNVNDVVDTDYFSMVVLYGYNSAFAKANSSIKSLNKNTWLILGTQPDISFLNRNTEAFQIENYPQMDEVQPVLNDAYPNFNLESFDVEDYPPVSSPFGQITSRTPLEILMFKQIGSVQTQQPLWFTYDLGASKHAVFAGSGLWRWRSQNYLETKDFRDFDDLINSQVQYLSSNKKRDRLDFDFKTFYYENDRILFTAQYLNDNYEFKDDGVLNVELINKENQERIIRPFVSANYYYTVDLSGLPAGSYDFIIKAEQENIQRSGSFSVLEFDIENQFVNANYQGLQSIATENNLLFPRQIEKLKSIVLKDPLMQDVEREEVTYQSLIDWKLLMGIILILLGLEWFLRKYNGLI